MTGFLVSDHPSRNWISDGSSLVSFTAFFQSTNLFFCLNFLCSVLAVSFLDAMEYAEMHNAIFIETSAKTAVNVAALFVEISKDRTEHFLYLSFVIIDERQQTFSAYFVL